MIAVTERLLQKRLGAYERIIECAVEGCALELTHRECVAMATDAAIYSAVEMAVNSGQEQMAYRIPEEEGEERGR